MTTGSWCSDCREIKQLERQLKKVNEKISSLTCQLETKCTLVSAFQQLVQSAEMQASALQTAIDQKEKTIDELRQQFKSSLQKVTSDTQSQSSEQNASPPVKPAIRTVRSEELIRVRSNSVPGINSESNESLERTEMRQEGEDDELVQRLSQELSEREKSLTDLQLHSLSIEEQLASLMTQIREMRMESLSLEPSFVL